MCPKHSLYSRETFFFFKTVGISEHVYVLLTVLVSLTCVIKQFVNEIGFSLPQMGTCKLTNINILIK